MPKQKKLDKGRDSPQKIEEIHPLLRIFEDCRKSRTNELELIRP